MMINIVVIFSGYETGVIHVWEFHSIEDFQEESTINYDRHSNNAVNKLTYNHDGSVLASSCSDKIIVKLCRENV